MRCRPILIWAFLILLVSVPAIGAGFDATLELKDDKTSQTSKSKAASMPDPLAHRAVLEASTGSLFTATWKVVRSGKGELKDALVHFYVVKMDRQGQAPPVLDPAIVVIESAITMDFPPGVSSGGTQRFRVDGPGVYLVRIEAAGDPDKPGVEDFTELELVVK
jgi:hypothetical protein